MNRLEYVILLANNLGRVTSRLPVPAPLSIAYEEFRLSVAQRYNISKAKDRIYRVKDIEYPLQSFVVFERIEQQIKP